MHRLNRGFICSECISAAAQPVWIPPPGYPRRRGGESVVSPGITEIGIPVGR